MSANFIPPIPIGQFKPSSEAIASWLYQVWKYLQENPIPTEQDVAQEATTTAQNYVQATVPNMVASLISALSYSTFVDGTSLPIYRASNDEIGQDDLREAWDEGCRFALVDDDSVFVMIKNGDDIDLLQILTENQAQGVLSVNGQTGNVTLPYIPDMVRSQVGTTDSNTGLASLSIETLGLTAVPKIVIATPAYYPANILYKRDESIADGANLLFEFRDVTTGALLKGHLFRISMACWY